MKTQTVSYCPKISLSKLLILFSVLIFLAGCIPKRIVWSPDGSQAAVLGEEGLYLCDPDGKLSSLLVPRVTTVAWQPDGKSLVLAKTSTYRKWDALSTDLPAENRDEVKHQGESLINALKAGRPWDEATADLKRRENLIDNQLRGVILFVRDNHSTVVREKSGGVWNGTNLDDLEVDLSEVHVGRLQDGKVELGPVLAREMGFVWEIRVSSKGTALVYATFPDNDQKTSRLVVVSTQAGGKPFIMEKEGACYPDWTSDGRSLAFVRATSPAGADDDLRLGVLARRQVLDDSGKIADQNQTEDIAGLIFTEMSKVRCLRDGRIFFTSFEIQLPAMPKEMPQKQQLFYVDPARQATVGRLIPSRAMPDMPELLHLFELSPDERQVSFTDDKGKTTILDLPTGKTETVEEGIGSVQTVSVWRSPGELCFIGSPATGTDKNTTAQAEVLLWKSGQTRVLSRDWPASVRKDFLDK